MKKILFTIVSAVFVTGSLQSQNITDAMRYAQDNLNGSARFRAMGGAFGALGGDLSSINSNPAGSVVFVNNLFGVTLSNFNTKNNSDYFGKKTTENDNSFDINQVGGVFVFRNNDKKSNWKKFALTINYENSRNLDNSVFSSGTNPTNSIGKYFEYYANAIPELNLGAIPLSTLQNGYFEDLNYEDQQAFLGYQAYIIDNDPNSANLVYLSNIPSGGNYYQENSVVSTGYNGKLSFNFASQYKDKFLFGINLNSHFTDYRQSSAFFESNSNPKNASPTRTIDRVWFNNELYTYGNGFSFQLGTIFKATKEVRIGLAYESPTWYRLNDELTQTIATSGYGLDNGNPPNTNVYSNRVPYDPNTTMVYDPYKLQTPSKVTGSFAYVFGKRGLISVDYGFKDYSNVKFKPKNDFSNANRTMANLLSTTNEIRVGAEYKVKELSLRAGYRFEQSPYKDGKTIGDLTSYSGGFGYNFGSTKLDLAYSFAKRDQYQQFFSQGLTDVAKINSKNNTISVTLLFEL